MIAKVPDSGEFFRAAGKKLRGTAVLFRGYSQQVRSGCAERDLQHGRASGRILLDWFLTNDYGFLANYWRENDAHF